MTNNAKHTPGPWTAEPYAKNSLGYKKGKAYYIKSDDKTPAFEVLKSQTFDHRNGVTGLFWDPSAKAKDAANARLIAAAPEFLEALETLTSWADKDPGRDEYDFVQQARAVIAKAKGE